MSISTVRIPTGLIADVIDCVNDRIENLTDLVNSDAFTKDLRDENARLINDLNAVVTELEDPGSVTWKEDE